MTDRRRRAPRLLAVPLLVLAVVAAPAATAAATPVHSTAAVGASTAAAAPTIEQLVGAKLLVVMGGTSPTKKLLRRVRRGEVGGVVLLGLNITSPRQLERLTRRLQTAAREGGQPPVLIAVDQEGGIITRIDWAPPTLTVPEMGATGRAAVARAQGRATGKALRARGVNVNLAPVADIPAGGQGFMLTTGRTFSSQAELTARLATAFARGLAETGTLATMKHFPGIGRVRENTDHALGIVSASRAELEQDLLPYRRAIAAGIPLIMLSNATYPAWDRRHGAGWSRAIVEGLLRGELGFTGVTVTDSLNGTAAVRGTTTKSLAFQAAIAGADLLLISGAERSSAKLFGYLVRKANAGRIPLDRLRASYDRIQALRASLATGDASTPVLPPPAMSRWVYRNVGHLAS